MMKFFKMAALVTAEENRSSQLSLLNNTELEDLRATVRRKEAVIDVLNLEFDRMERRMAAAERRNVRLKSRIVDRGRTLNATRRSRNKKTLPRA